MKKMKYVFTFLLALCFLPNMVSASQSIYYKSYKVGDEITVTLDKDGKVTGKFIVIEASEEKTDKNLPDDYKVGSTSPTETPYQYVTAIYQGTLGESAYAKNDDVVTYESSLARSNLVIKATDAGWINPKSMRLLTKSDINSMIKTLSSTAQKEILGDGSTLVSNEEYVAALKKYLPFLFNNTSYWLGETTVYGTPSCPVGQSCTMAMQNSATAFTSSGVSTLNATSSANLRPVIVIHKGFVEGGMICNCEDCETKPEEKVCPKDSTISIQACIDGGQSEEDCIKKLCETEDKVCPNDKTVNIQACINGGQSEEDCIKKLCPGTEKVENPKTGSYLPLFGLGLVGIIVGFLYMITRKKTYFSK
jgi:hypothetical protein